MKTFNEFLTETTKKLSESYVVTVELRDAQKANDLAKDLFRGTYKNDGSENFIFTSEDEYEDFKDVLDGHGIKTI